MPNSGVNQPKFFPPQRKQKIAGGGEGNGGEGDRRYENITKMAQKKRNNKRINSLSQLQSNWKWITILVSCIVCGFYAGNYYAEINLDAKIREIENQKQIQHIECREKILDLRENYQKEVMDLKNENNRLQTKIDDCRNGKAE
jgi:hypothetical protein